MTPCRASAIALAMVLVAATASSAHHSFSAVYDDSRTVTIQGVVTEFRFVNPHAMISVDVMDETGKVARWVVELAGRLNLADVGWTAESVKVGERITVTGNPTHGGGSQRIFFRRIVRSDGTELLAANEERQDAVEEDRRRRAQQRNRKQ